MSSHIRVYPGVIGEGLNNLQYFNSVSFSSLMSVLIHSEVTHSTNSNIPVICADLELVSCSVGMTNDHHKSFNSDKNINNTYSRDLKTHLNSEQHTKHFTFSARTSCTPQKR
jgi:protoporphyrinogen oxidase